MNSFQGYFSLALLIVLAVVAGGGFFYTQSTTFWSKDLETAFPSIIWLLICLLLTSLIFVIAYRATGAVRKRLDLPWWTKIVATPAIAIPTLNLISGYLFASLNGIDNVHGFPLSRPSDLFADQILLTIIGAVLGFAIWLTSLLFKSIVTKFAPATKRP